MLNFFKKSDKNNSIGETINSFAPTIKTLTGIDINNIIPTLIDNWQKANTETQKDILFFVDLQEEKIKIALCFKNYEQKTFEILNEWIIQSTDDAISSIDQINKTIKSLSNANTGHTNHI